MESPNPSIHPIPVPIPNLLVETKFLHVRVKSSLVSIHHRTTTGGRGLIFHTAPGFSMTQSVDSRPVGAAYKNESLPQMVSLELLVAVGYLRCSISRWSEASLLKKLACAMDLGVVPDRRCFRRLAMTEKTTLARNIPSNIPKAMAMMPPMERPLLVTPVAESSWGCGGGGWLAGLESVVDRCRMMGAIVMMKWGVLWCIAEDEGGINPFFALKRVVLIKVCSMSSRHLRPKLSLSQIPERDFWEEFFLRRNGDQDTTSNSPCGTGMFITTSPPVPPPSPDISIPSRIASQGVFCQESEPLKPAKGETPPPPAATSFASRIPKHMPRCSFPKLFHPKEAQLGYAGRSYPRI